MKIVPIISNNDVNVISTVRGDKRFILFNPFFVEIEMVLILSIMSHLLYRTNLIQSLPMWYFTHALCIDLYLAFCMLCWFSLLISFPDLSYDCFCCSDKTKMYKYERDDAAVYSRDKAAIVCLILVIAFICAVVKGVQYGLGFSNLDITASEQYFVERISPFAVLTWCILCFWRSFLQILATPDSVYEELIITQKVPWIAKKFGTFVRLNNGKREFRRLGEGDAFIDVETEADGVMHYIHPCNVVVHVITAISFVVAYFYTVRLPAIMGYPEGDLTPIGFYLFPFVVSFVVMMVWCFCVAITRIVRRGESK